MSGNHGPDFQNGNEPFLAVIRLDQMCPCVTAVRVSADENRVVGAAARAAKTDKPEWI